MPRELAWYRTVRVPWKEYHNTIIVDSYEYIPEIKGYVLIVGKRGKSAISAENIYLTKQNQC